MFGTPVGNESNQQTWNYDEFTELYLDKEKMQAIWEVILHDPFFWTELDPLNVSVMWVINKIANRIFITDRPGITPKIQSIEFLGRWGVTDPRVYVARDKVPVAQEQHLIAHIDDRYSNCVALRTALPDAYIALLWTPYNMVHHAEWRAQGGKIVLSVEQFIAECDRQDLVEWI